MPPVVIDLDGDGIDFINIEESSAFFDADEDRFLENTGWVSADDGFLVYDSNESETIDQTDELVLANHAGFEGATDLDGLATFDTNADGVFDAQDEEFTKFRVWRDLDQDGKSDEGELFTLEELNIRSINLTKTPVAEDQQDPDGGGNRLLNTTTFTRTDGSTGTVGDTALAVSAQGYRFNESGGRIELQIEDATRSLLFAKMGTVLDLDANDADYAGVFGADGDDTLVNSGSAVGRRVRLRLALRRRWCRPTAWR